MLKQAGLDHIATTDERAALLDAIQSSPGSGSHQQLSLQVSGCQHLFLLQWSCAVAGMGGCCLAAVQTLVVVAVYTQGDSAVRKAPLCVHLLIAQFCTVAPCVWARPICRIRLELLH